MNREARGIRSKGTLAHHYYNYGIYDYNDDDTTRMRLFDRQRDAGKYNLPPSQNYVKAASHFITTFPILENFIAKNFRTMRKCNTYLRFPADPTLRCNHSAASLWLFTHGLHSCIRRGEDTEELDLSTKLSVKDIQKLARSFSSIAKVVEKIGQRAREFSVYYGKCAKSVLYYTNKMRKKYFLLRPVKNFYGQPQYYYYGDGLNLPHKKRPIPNIKVADLRSRKVVPLSKFKPKSQSVLLRTLLHDTCRRIRKLSKVSHEFFDQMTSERFNPSHPSFSSLYYFTANLVRYLSHSKETTKRHRKILKALVERLTARTAIFMLRVYRLTKEVLEVRDTVELCYAYLAAIPTFKRLGLLQKYVPGQRKVVLLTARFPYCLKDPPKFMYAPADFHKARFNRFFQRHVLPVKNAGVPYSLALTLKKTITPRQLLRWRMACVTRRRQDTRSIRHLRSFRAKSMRSLRRLGQARSRRVLGAKKPRKKRRRRRVAKKPIVPFQPRHLKHKGRTDQQS